MVRLGSLLCTCNAQALQLSGSREQIVARRGTPASTSGRSARRIIRASCAEPAILANNPLAKLTVHLVQGELEIAGLSATANETMAALKYLTDLGFLRMQPYWLGATLRYKITALGTNAHERDEA